LRIDRYRRGPDKWDYSRGIVRRLADGAVVADIKRNYSDFWHAWVQHPNGCEYLLCGEDYQGYSIINLTKNTVSTYLPPEALKGHGFCWTSVYPSPDGLILAVYGCYWAQPYEAVLYDFSNPGVLPLPELHRIDPEDWQVDSVIGWEDDDTLVFVCSDDVRLADGARLATLPDEERKALLQDTSLIGFTQGLVRWKRSQCAQVLSWLDAEV
jgi:hypothetical protein